MKKRIFTRKLGKGLGVGLVVILLILVGGRIYLPYGVTDYVNKQIAALDGYTGQVDDIDIHLWRGAYTIHGLQLHKMNGGIREPFVDIKTADLSVEWRALFYGTVVAEIDFYDANLNFANSQTGAGANWTHFIDTLSPFEVNRLDIHSGKVAYINHAASPDVNLYIDDIVAGVTNLRNVTDSADRLPSELHVSGRSIGDGNLEIHGRMNILRDVPDFDLDVKLESANLVAFNNYARDIAAVDFEKGSVGVYSELVAMDGALNGYVKLLATKVSVVSLEGDGSNPISLAWQSVVSVFMELFKNQSQDQFALRVPIAGTIDAPKERVWPAFFSIFENAFAGAFKRDTDGRIDIKGLLDQG